MPDGDPDRQWRRRLLEAALFAIAIGVLWTLDTLTKFNLRNLSGAGLDDFRLIVRQATSAVAVFALVPAVAWWLTRFPLQRDRWMSAISGHIIGSGLFAFAHCFLMVSLRYVVYTLFGRQYVFSDFRMNNLLIEHQKDVKIYAGIAAIIAAYRYYRCYRCYRGREPGPDDEKPDRLIVQTGSGEAVIRRADIEYLEAARNYVVVSTGAEEYLVRETLGNLEESLAPERIVRTHRSYLVNTDRIEEIRPADAGGHENRMQSGRRIPLSRGFRDRFRNRITSRGSPAPDVRRRHTKLPERVVGGLVAIAVRIS